MAESQSIETAPEATNVAQHVGRMSDRAIQRLVGGNAGRNTIPGPGLFTMSFSVGRSFRLDDNRRSLEIRASSENVMNNVNIRRLGTTVSSSNFGLATAAGDMRTMTLSLRVRF